MTNVRDLARLAAARVQNWAARIFPHKPAIRYVLLAFVALLIAAFATQCRAEGVRVEVGSAVVRGEAPVLGFYRSWRNRGVGDYAYECGLGIVGESTFKGAPQRNQGFAECLMVDGFGRFDIGLGLAAQTSSDAYNTRTNFALLLRWRITDRISVALRHKSNAGSGSPNLGRDLLMVGFVLSQ